jgi:CO dehydrogenase nickel-insertion accessory protein CooC1
VKVSSFLVHVLSVSSLKGGVGKTTVTLGLASAAFARGLRTLVVDLDPQSDVSTGMDINVAGHLNVADVLASPKEKIVRAAIAPSGWTRGRSGKIDVMIRIRASAISGSSRRRSPTSNPTTTWSWSTAPPRSTR